MQNTKKTKSLILIALFAAITAICSWIAIPLPFTPIPLALAPVVPCIASSLLGTKNGTISMLVYVLIGAIGAPVFANFTGGLGHLVGPTGGYIIGYIASAFVSGIVLSTIEKGNLKYWKIAIAYVLGFLACYSFGTAYFMLLTKTSLLQSLALCIIPFVPVDALKIVIGTILVKKLRPALYEK